MVDPWVKKLTEDVIGPSPLELGKRYMHPEHGVIKIVSGQYWGEHGLSNHWRWIEEATGKEHTGYGENWPEIKEQ